MAHVETLNWVPSDISEHVFFQTAFGHLKKRAPDRS